jgi:hypothetical protein
MATGDQTYFDAIIDRRHSDSLKWTKYRDCGILRQVAATEHSEVDGFSKCHRQIYLAVFSVFVRDCPLR